MACLLLACPQPDQGVKHLALSIEHMHNLVGCLLSRATDPPELPLRQRVKKAEAEIPQVEGLCCKNDGAMVIALSSMVCNRRENLLSLSSKINYWAQGGTYERAPMQVRGCID